MGGPRLRRLSRCTRPVALLSAAATLIGALVLCLSIAADGHHPERDRGLGVISVTGSLPPDGLPSFVCPNDGGPCGLHPVVGAAVLTAPPLDTAPLAGEPRPGVATPSGPGGPARTDARPRAPGLHVLQVLRI
ncbi:hypothetical protein AB0G74_18235 [Streptomyces sp. NPDC020875]|uniref:hypothetical protein n=1 Tax=Streptomyces sp. NPDC020875 TaxID=3154898 RepID=UPI00340E5AE2